MRGPTFLFIGPDKSGSKWIHNVLIQHPECFVPVLADPYFFDRYYHRGLEWYFSLFANAPESARAVGELSHDYLFSERAAERIARDLPNIRLLVSLRHPAERSFSQYLSMVRAGITRLSFESALERFPELIDHSRYAVHLNRYLDRFEIGRIKILWYHNLQFTPREFADELFRFLGVGFVDGIPYEKIYNEAGKPRLGMATGLARRVVTLMRDLGFVRLVGVTKRSFLRKTFYRPFAPGERPRLAPDTRRRLIAMFEPDVSSLERLLGVSLQEWRV